MITVIADVAGQFDALVRLVDRLPNDEQIVLVGDLIDRGHFSFEVIEWAISDPRVTTILGNHEHMMLDYYEPRTGFGLYPSSCWKSNGGTATVASYARNGHPRPPAKHLAWIANLPLFHWSKDRDLLVTHAALSPGYDPEESPQHDNPLNSEFDISLIWNRGEPSKREYFQVFGHNSHWGLREFKDDKLWALCIDQSRTEVLTGFRWPSLEIITEPYLKRSKRQQEYSP